jgi:tetratricopeptide (TPR) repeat protein
MRAPKKIISAKNAMSEEKYHEAIKLFNSVFDTNNNYVPGPETLVDVGYCHSRIGDTESAIRFFEKAVACDETTSGAFVYLMDIYDNMGNKEQSTKYAELGLKNCPDDPFVCVNAGYIFENVGRTKEAIECYETVIETSNDTESVSRASINLAECLLKQENYVLAVHHATRALANGHLLDEAYDTLGTIYEHQNVHSLAIKYYQLALEINPKHGHALLSMEKFIRGSQQQIGYAKILNEQGYFSAAVHILTGLLVSHLDNDLIFCDTQCALGLVYEKRNYFDMAIDCYASALERNKNHPEASMLIKQCKQNILENDINL